MYNKICYIIFTLSSSIIDVKLFKLHNSYNREKKRNKER